MPDPVLPFRIVRPLGSGAMGSVYEVQLPGDPRRLAAKVLSKLDDRARERFRREGELMSRLRHPGIVSLHQAGVAQDGRPYLVFDLVEGQTLSQVLAERGGRLPPREALRIARELAEALDHAHDQGVIHRDVKPANVMLDQSGRVLLTDFGIALASDQERLTKTGAFAGTLLYMAPEQLRGVGLGPWTDVYAVGAVFYQLLTGSPPFPEETTERVIHDILSATAPDPRRLCPEAPRGASWVVARCLEKVPGMRYPSCRALADDLRALEDGRPLSTQHSAVRLLGRLRREARAPLLLLFLLLPGLTGALLLTRFAMTRHRANQVESLRQRLDAARTPLRTGGPERAQARERAQALLAEAAAFRARLDPSEAEAVAAAEASLSAALAAAGFLERLEQAATPRLPADQEALLPLADAVPDALEGAPEPLRRRLAEERGALYLSLARAPAARAALLAWQGERPGAGGRGRAAEALRGWVELACGDAAAGRAWLADAGPEQEVDFELAAAALAEDAGERTGSLERAGGALAGLSEPERDLAQLRLAAQQAGEPDPTRLAELLRGVRKLSDPPRPEALPAPLRGRASVVEGGLALRLGWWGSAAAAYVRALTLLDDAATPLLPVPLPSGGQVLLAPREAAALGQALAHLASHEPAAGAAAGEEAAALVRRLGAGAARDLAEWIAAVAALLEGRHEVARATLPGLGERSPALAASLEQALAGSAGQAPRGAWPEAERHLTEALADLGALTAARNPNRAGRVASPVTLERVERGLRLALFGEAAVAGRAHAALALAALIRRQMDAIAPEVARAAALAPEEPDVRLLLAMLAVWQGHDDQVEPLVEEALSSVRSRALGPVQRVADSLRVLGEVAAAAEGQHAVALAARLRDRIARLAEEDQLPPGYLAAVLTSASSGARLLGDPARAERLARARNEVQSRWRRFSELVTPLAQQWKFPDFKIDNTSEALAELLRDYPMAGQSYFYRWAMVRRLQPVGFDSLTVSLELLPVMVFDHFDEQRPGSLLFEVLQSVIPEVQAGRVPDPDLPMTPDPDLYPCVPAVFAAEAGLELPLAQVLPALEAAERFAWRRPRALAGQLVLARLRLSVGDAAGALAAARRARVLFADFEGQDPSQVGAFFELLACGALRDWAGVEAVLAEPNGLGDWKNRLAGAVELRLDRQVPASLHPAVATYLEQR